MTDNLTPSFPPANFATWRTQIAAVIRLEMRKTFFAKRGLWVYLLALAPVLLFMGRAIDLERGRESRLEMAAAHPVSSEALQSIASSMNRDDDANVKPLTTEDVIKEVGEPRTRRSFERRRRQPIVIMSYTDGQDDYTFTFVDNELRGVTRRDRPNLQQDTLIFATVFQFFYLRLAIFFGCVGIFMNLFRGEMIDKSLHFYLLAPIRREVLLVGKYLAGLIATVVIFTTSTALQLWMLLLPYDASAYLHGAGWHHIWAYLGVTALACMGYGSVFLAAGLLFRNPIIPAATVLLWESANLFLPAVLKKISVIFYLQSLCPVVAPPEKDMNALLALLVSSTEATRAGWAIAGLVALTLVILVVASLQARKLEINYGTD